MSKKVILIFAPYYLPGFRGGGPIRTMENLTNSLGDEFDFRIVTGDRDLGSKKAYQTVVLGNWNSIGKAQVFYSPSGMNSWYLLIKHILRKDYDILYVNSFFSFRFAILPVLVGSIFRRAKPIVVAPRGEFSQGALNLKKQKKKLFIWLSGILKTHKHVTWHASTAFEATDIERAVGKGNKCVIAVNISAKREARSIPARIGTHPLKIVFLSRISPKKNLLGALHILQKVKKPVQFDVFGPKEDHPYWSECERVVQDLPKNIAFRYLDELLPADVPNALANYDLLFFPTFGENFGHVIVEALMAGLPILISDLTPWRELEKLQLGWDVPLHDSQIFVRHIEACCDMSVTQHLCWRVKIQEWAIENIGNSDAEEKNRNLFLNLGCLND